MSVTKEQIKALTPEDRIVWKEPGGPREVELGLFVDEEGWLVTDMGDVIRRASGSVTDHALRRIARIIPPTFVPRVGMVMGKPGSPSQQLVCFGGGFWLGFAPEINADVHWFTDFEARSLIENHGWKVVDDLTKEKSDE